MNTSAPSVYGQVVVIASALPDVECWNFNCDDRFTLPAGTRIRVEHVNDAKYTTVTVVDEQGEAPGIELTYTPRYFAHIESTHDRAPVKQLGYRFIVENRALAVATGLPIPVKTRDLVGEIVAYETGAASPRQTKRLFGHLRRTGIGSRLQGHYSSRMGRSAA
jgi:hypothetical protein